MGTKTIQGVVILKRIKYEREFHKQKDITFSINTETSVIEAFYDYYTGEKIQYRLGKKMLKKTMSKITRRSETDGCFIVIFN